MNSQKVLLHICCGICSSSVIERLRKEEFEVTGYFYNPNICPLKEYQKRLQIAKEISKILGFELLEGDYENKNWDNLTAGLENEAEGGKRCEACFKMRLEKTYQKAQDLKISFFTTTLTVSPHKNASLINKIGKEISKDFLTRDFKKKDGFKKTIEFAKKFNFYRQHYCGCLYSMPTSSREQKYLEEPKHCAVPSG